MDGIDAGNARSERLSLHMNGRVYDPVIGRFLSVDPVFQFPENTQSLNPYTYVLNSPLSFTDPSGLVSCDTDPSSCNQSSGGETAGDEAGKKSESRDKEAQQNQNGRDNRSHQRNQSRGGYTVAHGNGGSVSVNGSSFDMTGNGGDAKQEVASPGANQDPSELNAPDSPPNGSNDPMEGSGQSLRDLVAFAVPVPGVPPLAPPVSGGTTPPPDITVDDLKELGRGVIDSVPPADVPLQIWIATKMLNEASKVTNENKKEDARQPSSAEQEREKNRANGIPDSQLGPSGRPKIHVKDHSTRKGAKDAAQQEGKGEPVNHPGPTTGRPHYHPSDESGDKVPGGTHHTYPKGR